jgi:16S rRNA (cytosine1402-N4)-methyltransferase
MPTATHIPVLLKETLEGLAIQPGGRYVDCTTGGGGHAEAILERSAPGGQLLGIDADPEAVKLARQRLSRFGSSALIINENFANLEAICLKSDFEPVNGILFDLGMSSLQISESGRGFSFKHDAPLDMRFSPRQSLSAADIVNKYSETELARIIYEFGEETHSRQIAHLIVRARPVRTTDELAAVIERAMPGRGRIHPATRTFQALRIAVNQELEHIESALGQALKVLGNEGRLVVISYHSLEDRIVKNFMRREASGCICPPGVPQCVCNHQPRLRVVHKGVVIPSLAEEKANPRSRSAKLRMAERIISNEEWQETAQRLRGLVGNEVGAWKHPEKLRMILGAALDWN